MTDQSGNTNRSAKTGVPISAARRKARHYAMQGLYQWQMAGANLSAIEAELRTDNDMDKVDVDYFHELLHGVPQYLSEVETVYEPYLQERGPGELDPITQALLRLASYEFRYRIDVPYKVVINEAVALAKKFGAADSHKFINGVLDKAAGEARSLEKRSSGREA